MVVGSSPTMPAIYFKKGLIIMNVTFVTALQNEANKSVTENGAVGYNTTYNELLDFNYKVPSLRKADDATLQKEVALLVSSIVDPELLLRYMFFLRDARGGMGERRSFRAILRELANRNFEYVPRMLPLIIEYGRYDDLFVLKDTPFQEEMEGYIIGTLLSDEYSMANNEPCSLLAKWMPSVNASSKETIKLANYFARDVFNTTPAKYRKRLSALRKHLKVVEAQISRGEFSEINYEGVPSRANLRYSNLFLDRDNERRRQYLKSLASGKAKINAGVLYPQDIVAKLRGLSDSVYSFRFSTQTPQLYKTQYNAMWKGLKDFGELKNTIVVVDTSGSMFEPVSSSIAAIDASVGLGLYFAERNAGVFKDKIITFSDNPTFVDVSKYNNILDKLMAVSKAEWGFSTNVEAVFDLVLRTAIANHCEQSEIPRILIISDMEFNYCVSDSAHFLMKDIESDFKAAGYELPKLSFWNVNSRTNTLPITQNKQGVALVSGYSPASIKAVMSNEVDPYKAFLECFYTPRYDFIKEVLDIK